MSVSRAATVVWTGDLASGTGTVSAVTTGLFSDLPVSWASRTEEPAGRTSPEELLAAAHASCFVMAMSGRLARAGLRADRLEVSAQVSFEKFDAGWRITRSALSVVGSVPGADEAAFQAAAESARDGCPISQALKGNVELSVEARLEQ